jgi:hypothetical protein
VVKIRLLLKMEVHCEVVMGHLMVPEVVVATPVVVVVELVKVLQEVLEVEVLDSCIRQ